MTAAALAFVRALVGFECVEIAALDAVTHWGRQTAAVAVIVAAPNYHRGSSILDSNPVHYHAQASAVAVVLAAAAAADVVANRQRKNKIEFIKS